MDIPKIYNAFTQTISNLIPGGAIPLTSCIYTARNEARRIRWTKTLSSKQKADKFSELMRKFRKEFTEEYGENSFMLVDEAVIPSIVPINIGYIMYAIEADTWSESDAH